MISQLLHLLTNINCPMNILYAIQKLILQNFAANETFFLAQAQCITGELLNMENACENSLDLSLHRSTSGWKFRSSPNVMRSPSRIVASLGPAITSVCCEIGRSSRTHTNDIPRFVDILVVETLASRHGVLVLSYFVFIHSCGVAQTRLYTAPCAVLLVLSCNRVCI